ncbi:hypothetical protein [Limosilactobacillus mucosae]|uniref:Uncharacterized protein n=1 Tax=Limosilactobacillus mucosae TaxID=97478 RepID=A0AAJ1HMT6_LIMMU|nr:hypothetical protein [Limosilactobacillus mucosae]MDC2826968.1 hypothetical protein [Limosilactobacillus mucosae]MDC2834683.1 hypothetical protein [Limosilactobacillus mucosae]
MKARENKEFSKKIRTNNGSHEFHILEEVADEKGVKKGRIIGFTKSSERGNEFPVVCRYSGEILIETNVTKLSSKNFVYKEKNKDEIPNGPTILFEFSLTDLMNKNNAFAINTIIDSFSNSSFTFKNEGNSFYFYVNAKHLIKVGKGNPEDVSAVAFYLNKIIDNSAEITVSSDNTIFVQSTLMPFTIYFPQEQYQILQKELDFYREMYDPDMDDSRIVQSILRLLAAQRNVDFEKLLAKFSVELDLINEEERKALVNEQRNKKQRKLENTISNIYPGYFA